MRFEAAAPNQGFDEIARPRFQLVPAGGSRLVVLEDGAGAQLSSSDTTVVRATAGASDLAQARRGVRLLAGRPGSATVTAVAPSGARVELEVAVRAARRYTLAFVLADGPAPTRRTAAPAQIFAMAAAVNAVYQPQANVTFTVTDRPQRRTPNPAAQRPPNTVLPPRITAPLMDGSGASAEWRALVALTVTTADYTVVFTAAEFTASGAVRQGYADPGGHMLAISDEHTGNPIAVGLVIAHEIGHLFGFDHPDETHAGDIGGEAFRATNLLMNSQSGVQRRRLMRAHMLALNPLAPAAETRRAASGRR